MKRICFVTTISVTLRAFVVRTAEYLHKVGGYDITMICDPDAEFAKSLPDYIHFIPVPMKRGISPKGILSAFKLLRIFRKERFDLVQYSTPNASFYAALAARFAKVPRRLYCQWGIAYVGFSGMKRKIFKTVEKTVCRLSTTIEPDSFGNLRFSVSEGLYPEQKGHVVYHGSASGVCLEKFNIQEKSTWREAIRAKWNIPPEDFAFLFVGRITGDKGINELFSAFLQLHEQHSNCWLLMVGNMEKTSSVDDALYEKVSQCGRAIFCGFTDVAEQYYAAADAYVLPSYREGFGTGTIEAEAMALPVIVSDIPGPSEAMLADKTGLLVPPRDADKLFAAMQTLYADASLCKTFGENGRAFAEANFEQQALFAKILEDRNALFSA